MYLHSIPPCFFFDSSSLIFILQGDLTFAAVGSTVCVSKRAHLLKVYDEDDEGNSLEDFHGDVLQMLVVGDFLLTLHRQGSLLRWRINAQGRKDRDADHESNQNGRRENGNESVLSLEDSIEFEDDFVPTCMCHPPAYLNKVVIGSEDGRVQLWNVMTRRCIYTFEFPAETTSSGKPDDANSVVCVVASPALDVVAVGFSTNKVILHNLKFDEKVTDFTILLNSKGNLSMSGIQGNESEKQEQAKATQITSVAFSTGTGLPLMAVGTSSGAIVVFDLDKRQLHCMMGSGGGSDVMSHSQRVVSLHFLANKPILMSSSEDNSLKQWLFNDTLDNLPSLLRFREGHSMPPTLVRHYEKNGSSDDSMANGGKLLSCSNLDKTFRVFSTHKDEQSFEMSQRNVARRTKRIKLSNSGELKLSAVVDLASCSLRENDWCNVVTAHANETCAYTWRLGKHALGEFTLQPPLSEFIHMQKYSFCGTSVVRMDTHCDAQNVMKKHLLSPVSSVGISHCGHYALVGCRNGRMDRYNLQSGFHRGSFYRYASGSAGGTSVSLRLAHDLAISGIQCDAFNKEILTAGMDNALRIWAFSMIRKKRHKTAKDDLLIHEEVFERPIEKLANHKHSALVAIGLGCCGGAPEIHIYDTWAKKVVRRFNAQSGGRKTVVHTEKINDLCFSQDGKWLLTCGADHKIAIWDVPGSQVLQVLEVPQGSACVSLSLSPGKTMLATVHENCKGIYLWSNKLVYQPRENLALRHSSRAIKIVDLPLLEDGGNFNGLDEDEELDVENEGELLDVEMDVNLVSRLDCDSSLISLSSLPRSIWHSLLYQEEIKERNKPKEVVKKPEKAPFFLGGGMQFETSTVTEGEERKSKISKLPQAEKKFEMEDLLTMSPAQIYLHILSMEGAEELHSTMDFVEMKVKKKCDFEFVMAFLQVFLKIHMKIIMDDPSLAERAIALKQRLEENWSQIDRKMKRVSCMLNHFLGLQ